MCVGRRKRGHDKVLVHLVDVGSFVGRINGLHGAVGFHQTETLDHVEEVVLVVSSLILLKFFH